MLPLLRHAVDTKVDRIHPVLHGRMIHEGQGLAQPFTYREHHGVVAPPDEVGASVIADAPRPA